MKYFYHFIFWTVAIFCLASALPLFAAERVALVIGNNAYKHTTPLVNCVNDAKAVAGALKKAGFTVIVAEDASLEQMEAKALEFRRAAQGAKAAWFHYSGHGAEVKGANYLLPVNADVKGEFQVKHQTFALDQMLGAMEESGVPLKVVVLDCCRNNPFGRGWSRSGSSGLAAISDTPSGTIIAFATSPGKEAEDGKGANSPFTAALVKAISTPGLDVKDVFDETCRQVILSTYKTQLPWISKSFYDPFVMLPGGAPRESLPADSGSQPESPPQSAEDAKLFKEWLILAEKGDAVAQFNLAICYINGDGTEPDAVASAKWLRKSAEQGNTKAQYTLGLIYYWGDGVLEGLGEIAEERATWFRNAVDHGYLDKMYENGEHQERDLGEAVKWLHTAAAQGNADAQRLLGICYVNGEGVKKDLVTAYMWINIADAISPIEDQDITNFPKTVSETMNEEQIKKAEQMAAEWLKQRKSP